MSIQLASSLSFPKEAITQTFAVLAVRGAGKSNTAAVMAEGMFLNKLPFVVIDPVGAWWGLRSSGNGKDAGLPIVIFGGRHGDVPLEKTSGYVIADLVVDQRASCVLDISEFSEGDKIRFLIDFGERLYKRNQAPLHLFLEEADDYCPQRPFREQARLLRVWENIVRRGRMRGLGITMITQRSASLNKNVLTQIDTLIVLRTTSPQDRKAIEAWVNHHAQSKELLNSLPSLDSGVAWVWSPQWLKILEKHKIHRRKTFDSGATPVTGKSHKDVATLADIDLGEVQKRMAETIERAKSTDPKELQKQIAGLQAQIRQLEKAKPEEIIVEVPNSVTKDLKALGEIYGKFLNHSSEIQKAINHLMDHIARRIHQESKQSVYSVSHVEKIPALPSSTRRIKESTPTNGTMLRAERLILTAIAQRFPNPSSRIQISVLSGYSIKSSGFANTLGSLRSSLYIQGNRDAIDITEKGLNVLGPYEPAPSGSALVDWWMSKLPKAERTLLQIVTGAYPATISKEDLSDQSGYSIKSSGFANALGKLRSLGLISGRGELEASHAFFN